jgi:DNA (cytosine-5)-methyltransferase 1
MAFRFVDLFSGLGGFHAALGALGGECVYASEIDESAARIYQRNWGLRPAGDITLAANDTTMDVPEHDVLVGGFPCQPFSKSGKQYGMDEARGTLFWNIAKVIEKRQPSLVLLENVRNIAGPRHVHEWDVIISTLRQLGYRVSSEPLVVSPHRIRPEFGGRPQVRERVLIAATRVGRSGSALSIEPGQLDLSASEGTWSHQNWDLKKHLPLSRVAGKERALLSLSESETRWVDAWNDFVVIMKKVLGGSSLPGFPIWADEWVTTSDLFIPDATPPWKRNFLQKNAALYTEHKKVLDDWLDRWDYLDAFPPSRRKLEWQAQDAKDLWSTVMHFRPSGIRAKKPTYVPAMVAITQTSVYGPQKRRLSVRECARLQGFPEWFDFIDQVPAVSYRQLGNAVNVGVVYNTLRAQVLRDLDLLDADLARGILSSPANPDEVLADYGTFVGRSTLAAQPQHEMANTDLKLA